MHIRDPNQEQETVTEKEEPLVSTTGKAREVPIVFSHPVKKSKRVFCWSTKPLPSNDEKSITHRDGEGRAFLPRNEDA